MLKQPICTVAKLPALEARARWFRAKHPQRNIAASIWQRWDSQPEDLLTQGLWEPGQSLENLGNSVCPGKTEGEVAQWLQLVAFSPGPARSPTPPHYVWPQAHEFYSLRWNCQDDHLELLETQDGRGGWTLSCYVPPMNYPIPDPEQARPALDEFRSNQGATPSLASVWQEAWDKLHCHSAYFYAAQQARLQPGAQILELGSNHWPVMPLGVFEVNPGAVFHTLDLHQEGLNLMGSVLGEFRPGWLGRVQRHRADFTQTLPLADSSIDLAVSVAAFGLARFSSDRAWHVLLELHRVLRPGGRFFWDGPAFESQPAWLTWCLLQRFKVAEQWAGGRHRELCLEKLA